MTLQQLKYIVMVEKYGSITKAAQALYVSQPGISSLIHSLEDELGITIFLRSPMGVSITEEGRELIDMAKKLLSDAEHIDEYFSKHRQSEEPCRFMVSSQHYTFVSTAFAEFINETGGANRLYSLGLNQTSTSNVIEDVCRQRSDLGILYIPGTERKYMERVLADRNLSFNSLVVTEPHIFISKNHPLAGRDSVSPEDLTAYPCIMYRQSDDSPSFYSEEILLPGGYPEKIIYISDLYLSLEFLESCNAYDVGTGIICERVAGSITSIPVCVDASIDIGYIHRSNQRLEAAENHFIEILKRHIDEGLRRGRS